MPKGPPSRNGTALPAPDDATAAARKWGRILIVEDDYFVAIGLEQALIDAGLGVVGIAATAEEALELAAAKRPDLAVMDIRLAGTRDGIDAALDLLSHHGVHSVFATAHSDAPTRARAERARPLGWLSKPYSAQTAVETIRGVLGRQGGGGK